MTDTELAEAIAGEAGALLLAIRGEGLAGRELRTAGDLRANELILDRLRADRPGDAILSEESADDLARLAASRVWIVDPLDGTREYGEGREDWAVHVALAVDGTAALGAVALPALGLTLSSANPPPLPPLPPVPRMLVSRSRPPAEALRVAETLGAALVPMGSAGAKAMAVVRGEAEIYLHTGGQHQWDNCAPAAVAAAAGLHVSRVNGSPLVYNGRETSLPDLLICRRELAPGILDTVSRL